MTYPQNHDDNHESRLDRASMKSLASPDQIKIAVADLIGNSEVFCSDSVVSVFGSSYAIGFEDGIKSERNRIRMNAEVES